jgi:PhnB protein
VSGESGSTSIAFWPFTARRRTAFGQVLVQRIELRAPENAVLGKPILRLLQGLRRQVTLTHTALLDLHHQACLLEDLQVLHHSGQGHPVRGSQDGHRPLATPECGQDCATSRIGQGAKGCVQPTMIVNHGVHNCSGTPYLSRMKLSISCNSICKQFVAIWFLSRTDNLFPEDSRFIECVLPRQGETFRILAERLCSEPLPKRRLTQTSGTGGRRAEAVDFYKAVFGVTEMARMPGQTVESCMPSLKIGDSRLFVRDPMSKSLPSTEPGVADPTSLHVYVAQVDAIFNRAIESGARVDRPVQDMFWGERYGRFTDPYGQQWAVATHNEDLDAGEIQRRQDAFFAKTATQRERRPRASDPHTLTRLTCFSLPIGCTLAHPEGLRDGRAKLNDKTAIFFSSFDVSLKEAGALAAGDGHNIHTEDDLDDR